MQHTDYIAGISSHIYFILQAIVGNDFEKKILTVWYYCNHSGRKAANLGGMSDNVCAASIHVHLVVCPGTGFA